MNIVFISFLQPTKMVRSIELNNIPAQCS